MPNSEDCLAKKLTTSGIHLDDSILDKIKNYFNHCTYMCCKIINQCLTVRIPWQNGLACLAYTLITVLQSKKKNMFQAICTNLCCKNYQSVPNSEDSLAKQLSTSGIYLYHSIVEHRKKHVLSIASTLYMYCKMINQCLTVRIPQQKGFAPLAYTFITALQSIEKKMF